MLCRDAVNVNHDIMSSLDRLDRRLVSHLKLGGLINDPVGIQIATEIINEVLENPEVLRLADLFYFSNFDLMILYGSMVAGLENPLINDPSKLAPWLVATMFFTETSRLAELMKLIEETQPKGEDESMRQEVISRVGIEVAKEIWQAHAISRGIPSFDVVKAGGRTSSQGFGVGGCGCLVIIGFTLTGLFSMACGGTLIYWIAMLS